jgi:hypothetical protein
LRWWPWRGSDIVANIVLYVPVGLAVGGRASIARTLVVSATLSVVIEIAQIFYVNRTAHLLDVACNVLGAFVGARLARRKRPWWPGSIVLNPYVGAAALVTAALWIVSSRTFRMFLGGYGWFADRAGPPFWQFLPRWVIDAGLGIHSLGLLANTAIAGLLTATGVIGVLQTRHPALRVVIGGLAGFAVGHMMTPNLNVYPVGPAIVGTGAGLVLAVCCVVAPPPGNPARVHL